MSAHSTMAYSVAIRTLGLNPQLLRQELETIFSQTVKPDKVVLYIAYGYEIPPFRVGYEQYVYSPKGMVTQRAVDYREIDTDLILLMDDDVLLQPDSAERLIRGLIDNDLDCISPDTFANHKMSWRAKVYAAVSNLTFPHRSQDWAFIIRRNGSFSYISAPVKDVYRSQSGSGPCSLWRKAALLDTDIKAERWLDNREICGFAYNEDSLEFYKLHSNGGRLGVHFDAGVTHVGGMTSSSSFHSNPKKFYFRAVAQYAVWHRSQISCSKSAYGRALTKSAFWLKFLWTLPVMAVAAVRFRDLRIPYYHIKGTLDGLKYTKSPAYKALPPYLK